MARVENLSFKKVNALLGGTNCLRAYSRPGAIDDLMDEVAMPEPDESNNSMLKGGVNNAFKHICKPLFTSTTTMDIYLTTVKTDNRFVASHAISPSWAA